MGRDMEIMIRGWFSRDWLESHAREIEIATPLSGPTAGCAQCAVAAAAGLMTGRLDVTLHLVCSEAKHHKANVLAAQALALRVLRVWEGRS